MKDKLLKPYHEPYRRWQEGAPVLTLCKELGIHSGHTLTKIFVKLAGGKEAYKAARARGAGGGHIPFGGKQGQPRTVVQRGIDDSKIKHLISNKRWTSEYVYEAANVAYKDSKGDRHLFPWRELKAHIFVSPKGRKYVKALPQEKADLIVRCKGTAWDVRLKRYADSAVHRQVTKAEKEVEHGRKAKAARKAQITKRHKHLKKLAR